MIKFKASDTYKELNIRRDERYKKAKHNDKEKDRKANEAYGQARSKLRDYQNSVKESPSPKLR